MTTEEKGQHQESLPALRKAEMERLANALGWFSIGLGLAQLSAPRTVSKLIGTDHGDGKHAMMRLCGLREIAVGSGILAAASPAGWMWGRVAGDIMDMASLGPAMRSAGAKRRTAAAATAVLGVTALDLYCGLKLSRGPFKGRRIHVTKTIIVNRPPEEIYPFWRDPENFPRFVDQLESVRAVAENRFHWKLKMPGQTSVEWDSEITTDQPDSLVAWRSVAGDIENSGSVRFERATGGRGTLIKVELEYVPPAGVFGSKIARLFGAEPGQLLATALRRMKQILETGDIVRSDASIHKGMHPARPLEDQETDLIFAAQAGDTAGFQTVPAETQIH